MTLLGALPPTIGGVLFTIAFLLHNARIRSLERLVKGMVDADRMHLEMLHGRDSDQAALLLQLAQLVGEPHE